MKRFKRIISLILVFCMVVPMFAFAATESAVTEAEAPAEEVIRKPNMYFHGKYDNVKDGGYPSKEEASYPSGSARMFVTSVPSKEDKSFAIELIGSSTSAHWQQNFTSNIYGKVCLQYTVRVDDITIGRMSIGIYDSQNQWSPLFQSDPTGYLRDAQSKLTEVIFVPGKFVTISCVVDVDASTYDLYVNYKIRSKNLPLNKKLIDVKASRLNFGYHSSAGGEGKSTFYCSEMKVYETDKALEPDVYNKVEWAGASSAGSSTEMLNDKLVYMVGSNSGLYKGKIEKIDSNHEKAPYMSDGEMYIPVTSLVKALGGNGGITASESSREYMLNDKTLVVTDGMSDFEINGERKPLQNPVVLKEDRFYITAKDFASAMGLFLLEDSSGLAIFSEKPMETGEESDSNELLRLCQGLLYEKPTEANFIKLLRQEAARFRHPRILYTDESIARIKSEIETSPIKKNWFNQVKAHTDNLVATTPLPVYSEDDAELRKTAKATRELIENCGLVYFVTGDRKYVDKILEFTETYMKFPQWTNGDPTIAADFIWSMSMSYDWLYDIHSVVQRNEFLRYANINGFDYIIKEFDTNAPWLLAFNEESLVMSSASLAMCMSYGIIIDVKAKKIFTKTYDVLSNTALKYLPDENGKVGITNWESFNSWDLGVASMMTTLRTDYGVATRSLSLKSELLKPFNSGDVDMSKLDTSALATFANILNDPSLMSARYKLMNQKGVKPTWKDLAFTVSDPQ